MARIKDICKECGSNLVESSHVPSCKRSMKERAKKRGEVWRDPTEEENKERTDKEEKFYSKGEQNGSNK